MNQVAVVTGISSGIGLEIGKVLLELGYVVYGISRTSPKDYLGKDFTFLTCDLLDESRFISTLQSIKEPVSVLVNCAGVGYFGQHEDLKPEEISQMINLNLKAPVLASSLLLKDLKETKGIIFNITSITGKENSRFGATYGATKAGLESFGKSLFDEARKSRVRVVNVAPDLTDTAFFDNLSFRPENDPEAKIDPKTVAEAVRFVLSQPYGTVITELTIRPQKILLDKGKK